MGIQVEELADSIINYKKLNIIDKIKLKIKIRRYFRYLKKKVRWNRYDNRFKTISICDIVEKIRKEDQ